MADDVLYEADGRLARDSSEAVDRHLGGWSGADVAVPASPPRPPLAKARIDRMY